MHMHITFMVHLLAIISLIPRLFLVQKEEISLGARVVHNHVISSSMFLQVELQVLSLNCWFI